MAGQPPIRAPRLSTDYVPNRVKRGFVDFSEANFISREDLDSINRRSKAGYWRYPDADDWNNREPCYCRYDS